MNNPEVTPKELRVRTVVELLSNEAHYNNMYSSIIGPLNLAIQGICKNYTFSELYEIVALCNVLKCNIRSIYPNLDFREYMAIFNNIFKPTPPLIANGEITIFWCHTLDEVDARAVNNGTWSPNHFVPLLSFLINHKPDDSYIPTTMTLTPEKKTFKNNVPTQIRIPEFPSSPNRRLRTEINPENELAQLIASKETQKEQDNTKTQRQSRLEKKREWARSNRSNETNEQRQKRLEKQKNRNKVNRLIETEEQRQSRLKNVRERTQSIRRNETEEQRQSRLQNDRERTQSIRRNETEEQRQSRLRNVRERTQSIRRNETFFLTFIFIVLINKVDSSKYKR
ncbi:unnamed protein product [Rotaria magnacalcarata]|nr:unnamed protein product [Rotaria magnacalcarata]